MSRYISKTWVYRELKPFFDAYFHARTQETPENWETLVQRATQRAESLSAYDNSIVTIDRLRLAAISPWIIVDADREHMLHITSDYELLLALFMRHYLSYGEYPVISLREKPNPEALRTREMLHQLGTEAPRIVSDAQSSSEYADGHGLHWYGLAHNGRLYHEILATNGNILPKLSATAATFYPRASAHHNGTSSGAPALHSIHSVPPTNTLSRAADANYMFASDLWSRRHDSANGSELHSSGAVTNKPVPHPEAPTFVFGALAHHTHGRRRATDSKFGRHSYWHQYWGR